MEDSAYIIRNQIGQYWIRAGEWVDGREPQRVLRFEHRDEAVNQLVELSAKDIDLRGEILHCELNERGEPNLDPSEHLTPTLAERAAAKAAAEREAAAALAEAEAAESGAAEDTETANGTEVDGGNDDGEEPASAAAV